MSIEEMKAVDIRKIYLYKFLHEVKIHIISFACDIEGDSSLLYVGGIDYGSGRSCEKI